MRPFAFAIVVLAGMVVGPRAHGQSLTTELDVTVGHSSEDVSAAATQARAFGELKYGLRYYLEAAWAGLSADGTDAFGAAYPYTKRVEAIETYVERVFHPGRFLAAARVGQYRTPFGIYSRSDHAYSGFLRAPLIRYDGYFALSNNFLERGADFIVGAPQLYLEVSLGIPQDVGTAKRRRGMDGVYRLQGYYGPWIVGVSRIRTKPYQSPRFAQGPAIFTGVDLRWMRSGVEVRGEWITGRPFNGTTTDGWYADAIIHLRRMGPFTGVLRCERLDYEAAAPRARHAKRQTAGFRVRLPGGFLGQVGVIHQSGDLPRKRSIALDLGLTYSIRRN